MAAQFASPNAETARLAKATCLSKTAMVERTVDRRSGEMENTDAIRTLLAQLDHIPDRVDGFDALEWDSRGLPPTR
jgi:hypothetical protein